MKILKKVPLFSTLKDEALQNIFSRGITRKFKKEEFIVRHGEEGDAMYLILKGSVKLTIFNENGKVMVLSNLREGDFFGELSLLDSQSRSCTVIAGTDCELFILTRKLFFTFIEERPALAFNMLKELTVRLRKANNRIESLAVSDVYKRTVQVLYEIADDTGEITDKGYVFENLPTHEELAHIVGTTRESVSRVMASIKKAGLIEYLEDRKVLLYKMTI